MFLDVIRGKLASKETSYRKLEYQTGISHTYIVRVVNGKKPLPRNPAFIEKICEALNLRPEDFPEYRDAMSELAFKARPDIRARIWAQLQEERRKKNLSG